MKKVMSLFVAVCVSLLSSSAMLGQSAIAGEMGISVKIDGKFQSFDQVPVELNGRTLVPLRGVFEALGAAVAWDEATSTVTAVKGNTTIILVLGNPQVHVNGEAKTIDQPVQLMNNRTMVPIRFVSETLGAEVTWEEASRTVMIHTNSSTDSVQEVLDGLDGLFKDYFTWLAGQYDPNTGGFYYARSSFTRPELRPDIESTAQAVAIMQRFGLLESMPIPVKEKLIKFFQSRQDPVTGYFIDPHNNMKDIDRMLGRALTYSADALSSLGAKPLYPVPGTEERVDTVAVQTEGIAQFAYFKKDISQQSFAVLSDLSSSPIRVASASALPYYLNTPEAYKKWMEGLDWNDPWTAADAVSTTRVYLKNMEEARQKLYLEQVWNFVEKNQDSQTGLWGGNTLYNRVSGVFKIAMFYSAFGRPMPQPDKIYASILKCIQEERATNLLFVRNPLDAVRIMYPQIKTEVQRDLPQIIKISTQNLKKFLREDGGFSLDEEKSRPAPNKVTLGLGLAEGDMNSATSASSAREAVYSMANAKLKPLTEYQKDFYENMLKKPIAVLNDITVNDVPVDQFRAQKYQYQVKVPYGTVNIPVVKAASNYTVSIEQASAIPGRARIEVTDPENLTVPSVYYVDILALPQSSAPQGTEKINAVEIIASAVPEAANTPEQTMDGKLDTRWSAEGDQWIQYDMGDLKNISCVFIAWFKGDVRTSKFDIEVSGDGVNFEKVYTGTSSGISNENENYNFNEVSARYVRIHGRGNNINNWNSISEVVIYGK